jgi:cytochrome P450
MTTTWQAPAGNTHAANEALAEILFSPEGRADPYSRYHRLRNAAPVHQSTLGLWSVSRFSDVTNLLRDKAIGKDVQAFMAGRFGGDWAEHASLRRMGSSMLWANPPDHTRLRRIINKAFTAKRIMAHRAFIERRVDELLEPLAAAGGGDILNEFCYPLPLSVISNLLGVPREEAPQLREPMRDFQRAFELGTTASELLRSDDGAQYSDEYFAGLVERRRAEPQDDLLSSLIQTVDEGDQLDHLELIGFCNMVIGAGFETTTHLLSNGIRLFAEHPGQADLVRADPGLLERALEEVLRFDPPVHVVPRMTTEAIEVGGVAVPERSQLILLLAAANRDPAQFSDPDTFDVRRDEGLPISFGGGIHNCLGWRLAKLQAEVVFGTLLRRFSEIEVTGSLHYRPRLTLRGLESLHVRLKEAR